MLSKLTGFLSGFWHNETSQMTKTGVLTVASTLGVLAVAFMPQTAAASWPCDNCYSPGMPCNPNVCNNPYNCRNEPNCTQYTMQCSGGSYYIKVCAGPVIYCGVQCAQ